MYGDIQWGQRAQIGFSAGDGINSLTLPESLTDQTVDIEERSNVGEPGVFIFRIDGERTTIKYDPYGSYNHDHFPLLHVLS